MRIIKLIALFLTIIGALNWGLIGLFDFNLVELIFGNTGSVLTRIVYILVGISGIIDLKILFDYLED